MGKLEALKNAMNQKRKEEELIRRADSLSEAWKYTEKILDQGTAAKKKLDESQARLIKLRKYQPMLTAHGEKYYWMSRHGRRKWQRKSDWIN